jgi:hypothetical protein
MLSSTVHSRPPSNGRTIGIPPPAHTGVRRGSTPRCVRRGRLLPRRLGQMCAAAGLELGAPMCTHMHSTHARASRPPARPFALRIAAAAVALGREATLASPAPHAPPLVAHAQESVPLHRRIRAGRPAGGRRLERTQQAARAAPTRRRSGSGRSVGDPRSRRGQPRRWGRICGAVMVAHAH